MIARRRSLADERRDSTSTEPLTQLSPPRCGSTRPGSLTRGVAGIKCETSMMPPEGCSVDPDDAMPPAVAEIIGDDTVAESVEDETEVAKVAPENEFRPADASSVAWCISWPDSWVGRIINGDAESADDGVANGAPTGRDAERTVDERASKELPEDTDDLDSLSLGSRCRLPSDCGSGTAALWHNGDPSPRLSGSTEVWVDRIRH